jgi:hypothetical protein
MIAAPQPCICTGARRAGKIHIRGDFAKHLPGDIRSDFAARDLRPYPPAVKRAICA